MTDRVPVVVRIKIKKGLAMPRGVEINGFEIPGLAAADVEYHVGDARTVRLKIFADEVVEVEPDDEPAK